MKTLVLAAIRAPFPLLLALVPCAWTCQAQSSAQEWQMKAVQKYPDLSVRSSALNKRFVEKGRGVHAEWTLTLNAYEGHEIGKTPALARAHLAAAIALRLPPPATGRFSHGDGPVLKPQRLSKQGGWLSDPATYEVAASNDFKGKKQDAVWRIDETTAKGWQQYLREPWRVPATRAALDDLREATAK